MKDKQGKHDHKLTKLLKFGLFATLMVAPLFAVLFKCMYVTFNKNAYQSYSNNELVSNTELATNIQSNLKYTFNITNYQSDLNTLQMVELGNSNLVTSYTNLQNYYNNNIETNIKYFRIYPNNGSYRIYFYNSNMAQIEQYGIAGISLQFTFISLNNVSLENNDIIYLVHESQPNTLDNAFYYSVNEMQNNSLFNWTTSTAIYTPINAMTSGLGITTDAVAILLTYWLYLTLIYIVIDIVVELFTWMTHTLLGKPLG